MTGNAFTEATGTANTAAASTIIIGTAIATGITATTIATSRHRYYDLIPSNWAAFPPSIARRSASLNPGVLRT